MPANQQVVSLHAESQQRLGSVLHIRPTRARRKSPTLDTHSHVLLGDRSRARRCYFLSPNSIKSTASATVIVKTPARPASEARRHSW